MAMVITKVENLKKVYPIALLGMKLFSHIWLEINTILRNKRVLVWNFEIMMSVGFLALIWIILVSSYWII
jgi:hypothetical protein